MKLAVTIAVASLLLATMTAPPAHAQAGHDHRAPATVAASAIPAERWATDAPLGSGMAKIRTAVDALQHYEHGHMGPEQAIALATQVQEQVAYLVANCKLEPQADAALHVIIAELSAGAQALKDAPTNLAAIPPMREALADYARNFDDPNFMHAAAVD